MESRRLLARSWAAGLRPGQEPAAPDGDARNQRGGRSVRGSRVGIRIGVALGERGRNPLMPRSTAEGAASLRAAGALERDSAVRCPDDMAAGFLGGFTATTLAKRRLTRPLYLRRANQILPGAYPFAIARCRFIDEVTLSEVNAGLDEVVLL